MRIRELPARVGGIFAEARSVAGVNEDAERLECMTEAAGIGGTARELDADGGGDLGLGETVTDSLSRCRQIRKGQHKQNCASKQMGYFHDRESKLSVLPVC